MCRNIKPLHNFDPPATPEEIRAASVQFVRKISGMNRPSRVNEAAFEQAVAEIETALALLLANLRAAAPPKNRARETEQARARSAIRYTRPTT